MATIQQQSPGDDLKKVMSDLSVGDDSTQLEVDESGRPKGVAPPPPPPSAQDDDGPTPPPAAPTPPPPATASSNDLEEIKLDAVAMLKPLIGTLDISPEEKFEAMIEIVRASDDQNMVAQAFDTAKLIDDNDRRAQALIDIINEINYINKMQQN